LVAAPAHFGSGAAAAPLAFFEAAAFLEVAQRSGSWACPATGRLGELRDLRPHAYLTAVLRCLELSGVSGRVDSIEVDPSGRWRPKASRVPFLSVLGEAADAAANDADGDSGSDAAGGPKASGSGSKAEVEGAVG
ncbi:hypothetical protein Agub_g7048, partial [Astrephomene gubernaculifera]